MAEQYRLEMRGVKKTFPGVKALDGVNLRVRPGTVHALMGENGAGKSTLMKCLFGIYKMSEDGDRKSGRRAQKRTCHGPPGAAADSGALHR